MKWNVTYEILENEWDDWKIGGIIKVKAPHYFAAKRKADKVLREQFDNMEYWILRIDNVAVQPPKR